VYKCASDEHINSPLSGMVYAACALYLFVRDVLWHSLDKESFSGPAQGHLKVGQHAIDGDGHLEIREGRSQLNLTLPWSFSPQSIGQRKTKPNKTI
jgi:hypothetical protein